MRKKLCRLAVVLLSMLLVTGCSRSAEPASPSAVSPSPEPEITSSPLPTQEPVVTLDYDEIRTIAIASASPAVPAQGYFTMSKDGFWGLMRADGTQLLPCVYEKPVAGCGLDHHWIWTNSQDPMDWDAFDAISAELTASGDGSLCPGHGGLGDKFFYDLDSPGRDTTAVDLSALRWYCLGTPGTVLPMDNSLWEVYGEILPLYSAHEEGGEGDPSYPSDPVADETGATYWYICQDGSSLTIPGAEMALWFFDEELAPVEIDGSWAYLDRQGNLVTQALYSPTWVTTSNDDPSPSYAACLQNGYAPVCREGQWGLLDSTGREVVPCENAGVAWEGTHLWIKGENGWQESQLPTL